MAFPFDTLLGEGVKLINKFIPDKAEQEAQKREFELSLRKIEQETNTQQLEINKVEAAHANIFVAGWRPFIGWGLGFALVFHSVAAPLIIAVCNFKGITITIPQMDNDLVMPVLLGMLGIGGMRSFEKVKGVTK